MKDINPEGDSDIEGIFVLGNKEDIFGLFNKGVVFGADDGTHGVEPWFSDGSSNGSKMLRDCNEGSGDGWLFELD